jgi:hypothetical protein
MRIVNLRSFGIIINFLPTLNGRLGAARAKIKLPFFDPVFVQMSIEIFDFLDLTVI